MSQILRRTPYTKFGVELFVRWLKSVSEFCGGDVQFEETSAKSGQNVNELFHESLGLIEAVKPVKPVTPSVNQDCSSPA